MTRNAWIAILLLWRPAWGWNAAGHRIASAIAYDLLTIDARSRVELLLKTHPDYAAIFAQDIPAGADAATRARLVFLAASTWPDTIRGDSRFYDDTRENARPTSLLPGFPSMARHTNWHYIDNPISSDGTPGEPVHPPNALTEIRRILKDLTSQREGLIAAYDLPWLVHLTEDVHQPLHCVNRFSASQPKGDAGGNYVYVTPGRNLHAAWDAGVGTDTSAVYVDRMAGELSAEFKNTPKKKRRFSRDPAKWVAEGVELAKTDVYTFGGGAGAPDHPIPLPESYQMDLAKTSRARIALAGFRLAAVLNNLFR